MKKLTLTALAFGLSFWACSEDNAPTAVSKDAQAAKTEKAAVPVDYSAGRAMNQRLGRGINLGNSWDADGAGVNIHTDAGWGNPIQDEDFKIIKDAGFNSVRLPVRWQLGSDYSTHTVDEQRLAGVKEDVELAIAQGLVVLLDFHHYVELNQLGSAANKGGNAEIAAFKEEKEHFVALWDQISKEFDKYPDSMMVFDILNEPTIPNSDYVNEVLLDAYKVIRKNAKNKTIMFESNQAAKFAQLSILNLPEDGNIIFSGHYYEPYTFSHQGHGYDCKGDAAFTNNSNLDFSNYVNLAKKLYPDVNGGHIPMNVGEFGVAGKTSYECGDNGPSDEKKARWAQQTVGNAERYEMSWHYWGFTYVGGFEAYDRSKNAWHSYFPSALILK